MAATDADHVPAAQLRHVVIAAAAKVDDHVPAAQDTQLLEPAASKVDDHVPAAQELHDEDPDVAHVPVLHDMQVAAEVAALVADHMPAAHSVQDEDPSDAHNPALHATHVADEVAAVFPDAVPATHAMQTDCDVAGTVDDHLPALQAEHTPAFNHVPMPHVLEHIADPGADTDPPLQLIHVATDVAAVVDENVPELHWLQAPDATADHVPAMH